MFDYNMSILIYLDGNWNYYVCVSENPYKSIVSLGSQLLCLRWAVVTLRTGPWILEPGNLASGNLKALWKKMKLGPCEAVDLAPYYGS